MYHTTLRLKITLLCILFAAVRGSRNPQCLFHHDPEALRSQNGMQVSRTRIYMLYKFLRFLTPRIFTRINFMTLFNCLHREPFCSAEILKTSLSDGTTPAYLDTNSSVIVTPFDYMPPPLDNNPGSSRHLPEPLAQRSFNDVENAGIARAAALAAVEKARLLQVAIKRSKC